MFYAFKTSILWIFLSTLQNIKIKNLKVTFFVNKGHIANLPLTFNICFASSNVMPALALASACAAPARPPPALRAASWLAAYSCFRALVKALPTICDPITIIWTIYLAMVWTSSRPLLEYGLVITVQNWMTLVIIIKMITMITEGRSQANKI